MGFNRLKDINDAYDAGRFYQTGWRKVPAVTSTQGIWSDLSMAPGNPKPNYYTGTELTATTFDARCGLYTGGDVSPYSKRLHKFMIGAASTSVAPCTIMLCDMLLFYPLVDMDNTDEQALVNTVTLPRYTDGRGVKAFLAATNPYTGSAGFFIKYTNHLGVSGCTSKVHTSNVAGNIGSLVNSNAGAYTQTYGPFLQLDQDDLGIRSVQSVQFLAANGGLAALVLCKPLATAYINEVSAFAEIDFVMMKTTLPEIKDGACLCMLALPNGSMAAQYLVGDITTVFN